MPVTAVELKSWLGEPAIYVFDCSGAGTLIPHFAEGAIEPGYPSYDTHTNNIQLRDRGDNIHQPSSSSSFDHNTIVLASCRGNEILPLNPQYPADVFTACLTTPIVMAVRWLILQVKQYTDVYVLVWLLLSFRCMCIILLVFILLYYTK